MRWGAVAIAMLLSGCTTVVQVPQVTTLPTTPPPTAPAAPAATAPRATLPVPCPNGPVLIHITSLHSMDATLPTFLPNAPPQVPRWNVAVSGTITNGSSGLVSIIPTSVSGTTRTGGEFAFTVFADVVALAPGQSTGFNGNGTSEGQPLMVTGAGTFIWSARLACGEPAVQVSQP